LDTVKNQNAIAIIGLSCRFPGARGVQQFWKNLKDGVESISFFSDQELKESGIDPILLNDSNYVKAGAVLEDIEWFDAHFFGYSPREAKLIDPQQRLFLECAWDALEDAGYNPETYPRLIGVFAGASTSDYLLYNIHSNPDLIRSLDRLEIELSNDLDYLATRVSYKLNLKGPSFTIQTACSTSLVAVNMACESLSSGQADMAIAGGVYISLPQKKGYQYIEGEIFSPDGHCRAFDAKAQGTLFGNGIGIVVLKRLADALEDGDHIYAVIIGYAINNDGSAKVGFTAPSVEGQANVITDALTMSGIDAETISYVETHGTGTVLGDPIEIAALTQAFRTSTQKNAFCAIGSVKTNIGHTFTAAGIASLIKTVMALKHKMIPPSLNFEEPNPKIDFVNSPFYVNTKLSEWKEDKFPRRAGVSSFGVGGTNAHTILEEAPVIENSRKLRPWQLILLSAKSDTALDATTKHLVEHLKLHPDLNLADAAYTLNTGRKAFDYRRMVVCQNHAETIDALQAMDPNQVRTSVQQPINREIVFMFSGQGSQYVNMGLELYRTEPDFQEQIDHCSDILWPHLSLDLRDIFYPEKGSIEELSQRLKQTSITQPALFAVEYALAKLWMSWGVHPAAMVGHSIGEYVAACLSGVFSLEDALLLVAARGRLMQQQPAGSMLAIQLSENDIQRFLETRLSLAAVNAPSYCVVSGEKEAIEQLEDDLGRSNVAFTRLHTSHAFHSRMMEPILDFFVDQARKVRFHAPQIPFVSNLTGTWITSEEATSPSYWAKHLRQTIRFSNCIQELLKDPNRIFLEVGPGQTLSTLVRQHSDGSKGRIVLSSLRHPKDQKSDIAFILNTLGQLWLSGVEVDWSGVYANENRHRIPLPTYPFERQRYWLEPQQTTHAVQVCHKSIHKKSDISDWFYLPSWKRGLPSGQLSRNTWEDQKLCWLLFVDECGLGSKIADYLKQNGQEVIVIQVGEKLASVTKENYTINPEAKDDYDALIKDLLTLGKIPQKIIHLWSVTANDCLTPGIELFNRFQRLGFYSLIFLTQALAKQRLTHPIELVVVTNNLHEISEEEIPICAEKATLLGPCRVIPQEYTNITCRSIDMGVNGSEEREIKQLMRELMSNSVDSTVAYRGKHRWVQIFEPVRLESTVGAKQCLKEKGVYLITGGLSGVGSVFAEFLAKTVHSRLVLIARTSLPEREKWKQWLERHDEQDVISRKIRKVLTLEELRAQVLLINADVADEDQMRRGIAQVEERFGRINGVIHAAGTFIEASIQDVSLDLCEQQFRSKVNGLYVLDKVLEGKAIDFCLLTSSLSSVLGGLGFVSYAAANLFMDFFAHRQNQEHPVKWISVNWDAWQSPDKVIQGIGVGADLAASAIKPKEGEEAFLRILSSDVGSQIVVSTGDLQVRFDKWINIESLREPDQTKKVESSLLCPRPTLSSGYIAPGNPTEQTIAEIWQELLNIERVGIHDNFFELGGHSLLATQVIARLRSAFPVEFPMASLFERPTVHLLSKMILEEGKVAPSFEESSRRGLKRKERRLQRMMQEQGNE
jgi:acyl transferase domain-containing protein/acyl carrier protein